MTPVEVCLSALGMLGAGLTAYLVLRFPEWAVALVIASVPLQGNARVGTAVAGITWTQAWLWTFLAVALALGAVGALRFRLDTVSLLFGVVDVCYAISMHTGGNAALWRNEVYRWSVALAFFLASRSLMAGRSTTTPLFLAAAFGAIWTGALAVVQVVGGVGPASFERSGVTRAYATFGEPNPFGGYAASALVALGCFLLVSRGRGPRLLTLAAAVGVAFAAGGLVLSQSRGALAATIAVAGVAGIVGVLHVGPKMRKVILIVAVVGGLAVMPRIAGVAVGAGSPREVTTATWANAEREAHWCAALRMVTGSKGSGVGAGQFDVKYRDSTPTWRFRIPRGHAHNAYLQVTAEAGLAGGLAYVALIAAVVAGLTRTTRRCRLSATSVAALAVTATFALHNLVDYLHVLNLPLILVGWWAAALDQREGSTGSS